MIEQTAHHAVLDRIFFISERITLFDGIKDVFEHIVRTSVQMTNADAATIRLFDLKTGSLKIVKGYGVSTGFLSQPAVKLGQGITGRVVMEGKPYSTTDVAAVPQCVNKEFARLEGISSVMSVPLKAREAALGCITVYRKKSEAFSEQDLTILSIFASQATEAVAKTRLIEELQRHAMYDILTGVYNKNALLHELETKILLTARHRQQFSVIFIDIDNFNKFNDLQGRLLGDKLLCDFANLMRVHCRKTDIIGRFGGEEFLIIAPNTTRSGAEHLAGKLLDAMRRHRFSGTGGYVHMTFSAGIAASPRDAKSVDDLIEKADKAMCEAKRAGKKRVFCWDAKQRS